MHEAQLAMQRGDTAEGLRLITEAMKTPQAPTEGIEEVAETSKETLLQPGKLYEIDTSKPEELAVAGKTLPIVAAFTVSGGKTPMHLLIADISKTDPDGGPLIDIGGEAVDRERSLDLRHRQRAQFAVLDADYFAGDEHDSAPRRSISLDKHAVALWPDQNGGAGVYLARPRPGPGQGSSGLKLADQTTAFMHQGEVAAIQYDSEGKLYIKAGSGEQPYKLSIHAEQLMEAADTPSFKNASQSPGFDYSVNTFGDIQAKLDSDKEKSDERWSEFADWVGRFAEQVGGTSSDSEIPGGDFGRKTTGESAQVMWKLFDDAPEERNFVYKVIEDGRARGMADKEIYREVSLALHDSHLSETDPDSVETKEKILRTYYDKKSENFGV